MPHVCNKQVFSGSASKKPARKQYPRFGCAHGRDVACAWRSSSRRICAISPLPKQMDFLDRLCRSQISRRNLHKRSLVFLVCRLCPDEVTIRCPIRNSNSVAGRMLQLSLRHLDAERCEKSQFELPSPPSLFFFHMYNDIVTFEILGGDIPHTFHLPDQSILTQRIASISETQRAPILSLSYSHFIFLFERRLLEHIIALLDLSRDYLT